MKDNIIPVPYKIHWPRTYVAKVIRDKKPTQILQGQRVSVNERPADGGLSSHMRSAHKGVFDKTCRGCIELLRKAVEQ